jgi:hypothetical protein
MSPCLLLECELGTYEYQAHSLQDLLANGEINLAWVQELKVALR